MFRNYLASALRNLSRNRLYAGVTITGLAIGFAAALLIGVYVRQEMSFDRFIPAHERIYLVSETFTLPGARPLKLLTSPYMMASQLKAAFPEIEAVARLQPDGLTPVEHGAIRATEQQIAWTDPTFFRILPMPALAGDPGTALDSPDAVVVTRSLARKYFGRDAPLGETLLINRRPYRVAAVLQDLPANTHLAGDLFISSRAPSSPMTKGRDAVADPTSTSFYTYIRLARGASVANLTPRLPQFLQTLLPLRPGTPRVQRQIELVPLTKIHETAASDALDKAPSDPAVVAAVGLVGALIVVIAAINFVTLVTARASRRAVEVGVRKAVGANRRDLIIQFMGEALAQVLIAAVVGVAMAELLAPVASVLLRRQIRLDYVHDPALAVAVVATTLVTAVLAGAYPAFVLSSFRPSAVLKGVVAKGGGALLREVLVIGQFALLIGVVVAALTIARQTLWALNAGGHVDQSGVSMVLIRPCSPSLRDEIASLPGVRSAACASTSSLALGGQRNDVEVKGRTASLNLVGVDFGFFETFGVRPLAGRLFHRDRPADAAASGEWGAPVVINETAVRRLGLGSPTAALGHTIVWRGIGAFTASGAPPQGEVRRSEIVGVVPDFTLGSLREPIEPTLYAVQEDMGMGSLGIVAKLAPRTPPSTLAMIDRLGRRYSGGPVMRVPAAQFSLRLYIDTIIQGAAIGVAGLVALIIAALGLFALAAYTAERRTKEIGVRKAMGARSSDILRLLLWQFTVPVLVANLLAWPAAFLVMRWWLQGFAYHVNQTPWTFATAGIAAVIIGLGTVAVQSWRAARTRPVEALRYE